MSYPLAVTLQASAAQTASGTSTAVDLQSTVTFDGKPRAILDLILKVTAISGTFTAGQGLTVTVQTSPDGTLWQSLGAFTLTATTGYQRVRFATFEQYARISWTLTGSALPSATFDVTGTSNVVYATPVDFALWGLPALATSKVSTDTVCAALLAATSEVDSYIPKRYLLPLSTPYPEILKQRVCDIAAMTVMQVRGFKPDGGTDKLIVDRWRSAMEWLKGIAKGDSDPPWVDASPDTDESSGVVVSGTARDWTYWWV